MSVYHLHVDTSALTLLVVLCAPVVKDISWVVMGVLALVCNSLDALNYNSPNYFIEHDYCTQLYLCLFKYQQQNELLIMHCWQKNIVVFVKQPSVVQ